MQFKDVTGMRFGLLVAVRPENRLAQSGKLRRFWVCRCDCGTEKAVASSHLYPRETKSCGCLIGESNRKRKTTHGMTCTPEFYSWQNLIQRCNNVTSQAYMNYGGRGIKVCERWLKFENFYADMGPRTSAQHSIDRINNDGNYEPGNCRWATRSDQAFNRRKRSGK